MTTGLGSEHKNPGSDSEVCLRPEGDKVSLCAEAVHHGSRPPWQKDEGERFLSEAELPAGRQQARAPVLGSLAQPWLPGRLAPSLSVRGRF